MKAKELYAKLEKDFKLGSLRDDWKRMDFKKCISANFRKRYMGVVLDNSEEIKKVYTAVFPSDRVLSKVLELGKQDALLFTHHPMVWDIGKGIVFSNMNKRLLAKLKQARISMYTLHVPLDRNGKYSTSVSLAHALGMKPCGDFFEYYGTDVGTIGKTKLKTIEELAAKYKKAVGHRVSICKYGDSNIKDGKVGFIGGGGNCIGALTDLVKLGVNTLATGITVYNDYSRESHAFAKKHRINLIGGTHYSSEKFACIAMCGYFKKLGLPSQFVEDKPLFADLG